MAGGSPSVVVLAGANGSGKSTTAAALLKGTLSVSEFVNADVIARGLSGFGQEAVALAASAIMLRRLHELAEARASFAFETTLASRSPASWLADWIRGGYQFHLVFLWLSSADLAVQRVARRMEAGGHGVPESVIRRRYDRGLRNFFHLYRPIATTWQMLDNSTPSGPSPVAAGRRSTTELVADTVLWMSICRDFGHE